jgi:hypothetical protein
VAVVLVPTRQGAKEALPRVVEEDLVPVANDRLAAELSDGCSRPREDDVRLRGHAVQAVPAGAVRRAPKLANEQLFVLEQGPTDLLRLHCKDSDAGRQRKFSTVLTRGSLTPPLPKGLRRTRLDELRSPSRLRWRYRSRSATARRRATWPTSSTVLCFDWSEPAAVIVCYRTF